MVERIAGDDKSLVTLDTARHFGHPFRTNGKVGKGVQVTNILFTCGFYRCLQWSPVRDQTLEVGIDNGNFRWCLCSWRRYLRKYLRT